MYVSFIAIPYKKIEFLDTEWIHNMIYQGYKISSDLYARRIPSWYFYLKTTNKIF